MKNYQIFRQTINAMRRGFDDWEFNGELLHRNSKGQTRIIDKVKEREQYNKEKSRLRMNIGISQTWLSQANIFEVEDKIKKICFYTNVPKQAEKQTFLPHNPMFIDVEFTNQDFEMIDKKIVGILLGERKLTTTKQELTELPEKFAQLIAMGKQPFYDDSKIVKAGKTIGAYLLVETQDGNIFLDSVSFSHQLNEPFKDFKYQQMRLPTSTLIKRFVINFLNFINNPEVITITKTRSQKGNVRRIKQGKMPLPNSQIIRITGLLKQYIDKNTNHIGWHYTFRFPVRTHLRRLRGKDGNVEKVIKIDKFYKGQGITIEKNYEVKADKKHSKVKEWNEENLDYEDIKPLKKPLKKIRDKKWKKKKNQSNQQHSENNRKIKNIP